MSFGEDVSQSDLSGQFARQSNNSLIGAFGFAARMPLTIVSPSLLLTHPTLSPGTLATFSKFTRSSVAFGGNSASNFPGGFEVRSAFLITTEVVPSGSWPVQVTFPEGCWTAASVIAIGLAKSTTIAIVVSAIGFIGFQFLKFDVPCQLRPPPASKF